MRLVRFPGRTARVSDDVRPALASLGRGDTVVGGLALLGVRPSGLDTDIDAILLLPHGVFVVVGVDLPNPVLTLQAPLRAQWKADGWPLVRGTDEAVNPAAEALNLAGSVADRVRTIDAGVGVATIVAVGPFVNTVEQPAEELADPVRVIYPTASSLWAATEALPATARRLTTGQARALLHGIAPTAAELTDAELAAEGFAASAEPGVHGGRSGLPGSARTSEADPTPASAAGSSPVTDTGPVLGSGSASGPTPVVVSHPELGSDPALGSGSASGADGSGGACGDTGTGGGIAAVPTGPAAPGLPRRRTRRRRIATATGLLTLVAATTLGIVATIDRGTSAPAAGTKAGQAAVVSVGGLDFSTIALDRRPGCGQPRAVGDLEDFLLEHGCEAMRRGSFITTVDGRPVAVSVATVTFATDTEATAFRELAETPGTGTMTDAATLTDRWPGRTPEFARATFSTAREGRTVWLVLADALDHPSTPDDGAQVQAAGAAMSVPLGR